MKYEIREVSPVKRELDVEVPASRWRDAVASTTRELSKKVRLPGFRPGKVPKGMLRKMFGDEIEADVLEHLVPELTDEALEESGLDPINRPVLQDKTLPDDSDRPMTFTVAFEVMPKVTVEDYKGLELTEVEAEVTDEDVKGRLEELREKAARFVAVDHRPAVVGDYVVLDLERENGQVEKNVLIPIREDEKAEELEKSLVGKQAGDVFDVTIQAPEAPSEEGSEEGEPAERPRMKFKVTVQEIKERQLPEVDDDFARDVGSYENLAELESKLREELAKTAEATARRKKVRQALEKILEKNEVVAPSSLVEKELHRQLEQLAASLKQSGLPMDQLNWEALAREARPDAELSVKLELVFDAIAEAEDIPIPHDKIEARIEEMAKSAQRTPAAVRAQLEKEDQLAVLAASLRREGSIDLVLQNARVTTEE